MANLTCFNVGQGFSLANVWKSFSLAGAMLLFFSLFTTYCLLSTSNAHAFEPGFPKLVWEKEYPFELDSIRMASESGDVLISNKDSAQLILIDSQGYERLHLGPTLNRALWCNDISADGNKILYLDNEGFPSTLMDLPIWMMHIIDRKGNHILKKEVEGIPFLSPKGDWYVLSTTYNADNSSGNTKAYDITGKLLWKNVDPNGNTFSLDNNYFITGKNINGKWMSAKEEEIIIHTYSRQGEQKWEGKFKTNIYDFGIAEIVKGGYVVWNYKDYYAIYDYLGNKVTDIPIDIKKSFISPDGKVVFFQYDNNFKILNLPDKSIKMEGLLKFEKVKISNEGKYLIGSQNSLKNIVIIDIQNKLIWNKKIEGEIDFFVFTFNGKYLLISEKNNKQEYHISYYQLW